MNLKVTYCNCPAKSCVNIFTPAARKEIFGVVLSDTLKNVGITVTASDNDSHGLQCLLSEDQELG